MLRIPLYSGPAKVPLRSRTAGTKLVKRAASLFIFLTALYLLVSATSSSSGILPKVFQISWRQQRIPTTSRDRIYWNPDRTPKPRAAFVMLVRERELHNLLPSIRDLQWAFNDDLEQSYNFIILSERPFTKYFQDRINDFLSKRPSSPTASFGLVPKEHWQIPSHIDLAKAKLRWEKMKSGGHIPYAGSKNYRQMCRYMSGPIFHHPLLKDLDYYWRIEPETKHLCTLKSHWKQTNGKAEWIERDPFRYMRDNNKKYAWSILMKEFRGTVMTLMAAVNVWRKENPSMIATDNAYSFVSDDGIGYNMCHFWSNFEIIDLSFVRGQEYTSYFESLDKAGGFFYERWGDAPVRSIAAAILLNRSEIWQVENAGYYHPPFSYCPRKLDPGQSCACDSDWNIDYDHVYSSCRIKWDKLNGVDSVAVIHALNEENGVQEGFAKGEDPYVIKPQRLGMLPDT